MSEATFANLIAKARNARSPEAIAHLLKPVLIELSDEFNQYLEHLLATTSAESSAARTLKLIARIWRDLEAGNQREIQLRNFARSLANSEATERPMQLLAGLDPNGELMLADDELQQLIRLLEKREDGPQDLAAGLQRGLNNYLRMEARLLDWMYGGESNLGFVKSGPWGAWATQLPQGTLRSLFESLDRGEPASEFLRAESLDLETWAEITILLRRIERYLIRAFETRYPNLSDQTRTTILTSTFLTFAIFWADFAQALVRNPSLSQASFQSALQILRSFASQTYFPLYGGLLALFDGPYLRAALAYLGEPLRASASFSEKAKMLNLLGYTCRYLGDYQRSIALHREALQVEMPDQRQVQIANWINLGSTYLRLKEFETAVELFERALVYARQIGDASGEAHALANLGNGRSLVLQSQEILDADEYGSAEMYLLQGLERSRQVRSRAAEVAALTGLGALKLFLGNNTEAVNYLEQSLTLARAEGDLWWQGSSHAYLAEALYSLDQPEEALIQAATAMILLERLGSTDWRQPAGLLSILQGKLGERFSTSLEQSVLGRTGTEQVQALLQRYKET
jgi:tetratricopeptide (TPR) repeat protein